jgi:hypothetical protein
LSSCFLSIYSGYFGSPGRGAAGPPNVPGASDGGAGAEPCGGGGAGTEPGGGGGAGTEPGGGGGGGAPGAGGGGDTNDDASDSLLVASGSGDTNDDAADSLLVASGSGDTNDDAADSLLVASGGGDTNDDAADDIPGPVAFGSYFIDSVPVGPDFTLSCNFFSASSLFLLSSSKIFL